MLTDKFRKHKYYPEYNTNYVFEELDKGDFDVFHPTYYSDYFLSHLNGKPFVLTIHDMIPELYTFETTVDKETDKINPVQMEGFKELAPGIYRMYLTCKEKRDSQRQLIRSSGGVQYATLKKLSDGTLLVSNSEVDDIDTGIQTVHSAKTSYASNTLYNLKGQMISPNAKIQKGIYVVNGKKVIR